MVENGDSLGHLTSSSATAGTGTEDNPTSLVSTAQLEKGIIILSPVVKLIDGIDMIRNLYAEL